MLGRNVAFIIVSISTTLMRTSETYFHPESSRPAGAIRSESASRLTPHFILDRVLTQTEPAVKASKATESDKPSESKGKDKAPAKPVEEAEDDEDEDEDEDEDDAPKYGRGRRSKRRNVPVVNYADVSVLPSFTTGALEVMCTSA